MVILPIEIYAMHERAKAAKQRAAEASAAAKDKRERFWVRNNLGADALEKFQSTVVGIHRRFDEVMERRAVVAG